MGKTFGVSRSFVEKLFRQRRLTGSLAPGRQGGWLKPLLDPEALELVGHLVQQQPDLPYKSYVMP
ncbi:MAG: hypothetical protein ACE5Q6_19210 [Dehalococcoidia bacterium]